MKQKGFTLIELLVVIAIIGLLASVVLVALNSARSKGRDAKRVSDLHQLQTAIELYYNDNNGQYPNNCGMSTVGSGWGSDWNSIIPSTYLSHMPVDPTNTTGQYGYYYCIGYKPTGNCSFTQVTTTPTSNYILATRLENPTSIPNSCAGTFGGWDNQGTLNYLVGNGQ